MIIYTQRRFDDDLEETVTCFFHKKKDSIPFMQVVASMPEKDKKEAVAKELSILASTIQLISKKTAMKESSTREKAINKSKNLLNIRKNKDLT